MARDLRAKHRDPRVRLDWKSYFVEFCRVHGEPVLYQSRLLFRDGWRYSSTSHAGPEYPPPSEHGELDLLVVQYWLLRKSTLERALSTLVLKVDGLKEVARQKSLPLRQATSVPTENGLRPATRVLDLTPLEEKVRWLREDICECEVRLREIESVYKRPDGESTNGDASNVQSDRRAG